MRAEDILPDDRSHASVAGRTIRKGTVAAFLANARLATDPATADDDRAAACRQIADAVPDLAALGLFTVMEVRDPALRRLIAAALPPA